MFATRVLHYRDPAASAIGLSELRRTGLTPRGLLFIALDSRGDTHLAVPQNVDAVGEIRVGDKLSLTPPWEGRYFHFDSIHRLPTGGVLWNGDRRLAQTGSYCLLQNCGSGRGGRGPGPSSTTTVQAVSNAAPILTLELPDPETATICWPTVPLQIYRLESRTNLNTGSWTTVGDLVVGDGSPICQDHPIAGAARFYRVAKVPNP